MKILKTAILALAFAAVSACGDSGPAPSTAAKPAAQQKKKTTAPGAAAAATTAVRPEIVTTVQYLYNPLSKRDPFRSPDEMRRVGPGGTNVACSEPLCQWDLEQLTLVAVVTGDANPIAMVEDPSGRGYIIKRTSRMGRQGGKVTTILRDSVTVTEYWTQPNGESKAIPKQIKISEDRNAIPTMDLLTGKMVQ